VIIGNVVAYNVDSNQGILISGIPGHIIKDVDIKDVKIYSKGGGTAEQASKKVPELEKGYPEPESFGILPAYGIFARHVEQLKLENIELHFMTDDQRPAVILDDVKGAELRFVKAQTSGTVAPVNAKNSEGVNLFQSLNLPDGISKN